MPSYLKLVRAAILARKEPKGTSRVVIERFVRAKKGDRFRLADLRRALAKGLRDGALVQHPRHTQSYMVPVQRPPFEARRLPASLAPRTLAAVVDELGKILSPVFPTLSPADAKEQLATISEDSANQYARGLRGATAFMTDRLRRDGLNHWVTACIGHLQAMLRERKRAVSATTLVYDLGHGPCGLGGGVLPKMPFSIPAYEAVLGNPDAPTAATLTRAQMLRMGKSLQRLLN